MKGVPNKNRRELLARIQEECPGYDPVVAMAIIACNEENDISLRMTAHKEVAQYVSPKLKAVEHSGNVDGQLTVEIVRFSPAEAK